MVVGANKNGRGQHHTSPWGLAKPKIQVNMVPSVHSYITQPLRVERLDARPDRFLLLPTVLSCLLDVDLGEAAAVDGTDCFFSGLACSSVAGVPFTRR